MIVYWISIRPNENKVGWNGGGLYALASAEAVMVDLPIFLYFWARIVILATGG